MLKRVIAVAMIAVVVVLFASTAKYLQHQWQQPLKIDAEGYHLVIGSGQTLRSVVAKLEADGIYQNGWMLSRYGRWTGLDQQIKRGEYLVPTGTTPVALLRLLQQGKVIRYQVTLPEGITVVKALQILAQNAELQHELSGIDDEKLKTLTRSRASAEGLFFPDSYQFERGASDWDVLSRAHAAMAVILEEEWQGREEELPYKNAYEALIMASIVERETGQPAEREEIAGVFVRRMNKGMRLQTDPTVIYGLGETFDGNLRREHLRDDNNVYNTYRHKGLPPTPIALPGRAAIHAALHPNQGASLYFVAKGDGGHYFSESLAEHQAAVRKYQLQRRQDYRSSPAKQ